MVEPHHIHWVGSNNDVNLPGSVVDHKSTSGCYFTLGYALLSWMSRKQKLMALSNAEAEYIAAWHVVKLLERFGMVDCKSLSTPMELNFKKLCGNATGLC